MEKSLVLIVPCFNEEEALPNTMYALKTLQEKSLFEVLFVDDGSRDTTWEIITKLSDQYSWVKGIKLSRNFGHQNALLAGMMHAKGKFTLYLTLDADLQDDPTIIPKMIKKYHQGAEIIYACRDTRKTDARFKRITAQFFYVVMHWLKVPLQPQHADFRLFTNAVLEELARYDERNLFLRGIFPDMGFPSAKVFYQRARRTHGKTKYPLRKMIGFAWNGITSFSTYPVRLILYIGVITFLFSLALGGWVIYTFWVGKAVPGWSSIVLPISAFGGIQMISLGIIGEYLGKIYQEVKKRPRFIIEKEV